MEKPKDLEVYSLTLNVLLRWKFGKKKMLSDIGNNYSGELIRGTSSRVVGKIKAYAQNSCDCRGRWRYATALSQWSVALSL